MNIWLQLGLGGAALFLVYYFIKNLFAYLSDNKKYETDSNNNHLDKLCEKIDRIIESNQQLLAKMDIGDKADIILQNVIDIKVKMGIGEKVKNNGDT